MSHVEDARASLEQIAEHQDKMVEAVTGGRHRGWDAAGAVVAWASIASLDLPLPDRVDLIPGLAGLAVALTFFTLAGRKGRAVLHHSRMTGRTWAVLGLASAGAAAVTFAAVRLLDGLDFPLRYTVLGGIVVAAMALSSAAVNRAAFRRRAS